MTLTALSAEQINDALRTLEGWRFDTGVITAVFKFQDFVDSMAFTNRVAELAETHDHHPDIMIQYNTVTLSLVTHDAGGLTQKDMNLARDINRLVS